MKLVKELLFNDLKKEFSTYLCYLILAGLGQALLLLAINLMFQEANTEASNTRNDLLFFSGLLLIIFTHLKYYKVGAKLTNALVSNIQMNTAKFLMSLPLREIELLKVENIQLLLINKCRSILARTNFLSTIFLYFVVTFFVLIYLLTISFVVFITALLFLIIAFVFFYKQDKANLSTRTDYNMKEQELIFHINYLIKGFRDLKINRLKSSQALKKYNHTIDQMRVLDIKANTKDLNSKGFFELYFFALTLACLLILPNLNLPSESIVSAATSILFILPLIFVAFIYSGYIILTISDLNEIEKGYTSIKTKGEQYQITPPKAHRPKLKKSLKLKDVYFNYLNEEGKVTYSFGPSNLTIKKGEILFIVGSNGSGKSTILKILTGLYTPHRGKVLWDDKEVGWANHSNYKELFAVIFTDFHLFDRLYGIEKLNIAHIDYLLELMELSEVTQFSEDRFSSTMLSSGQKKRLAMLLSFLDNKEVYILDEVAADQDPGYRKFFYYTVLPELKKAGKTVLVVSHDDHYFQVADRIIEMKDGKVSYYNNKNGFNTKTKLKPSF